jgi:ferritin-like protein
MKNNMNVLNATYGTFAKREELKPFLVLSGYYTANVTLYNSSGTSFKTFTNAADSYDIFIAKYDAAGIGIWATRISSTGSDGVVNLLLDSTNNVYISGYYTTNVTLYNSSGTSFATLTNAGSEDTFIAKYNAAGIGIWATRISSNGSDLPVNLLLDSANNVYISGYYTQANVSMYNSSGTAFATLPNAAGSNDIFIAKYDAAGIGIWATRISSISIDVPVNMILDSTNNVYISGYYYNETLTLYNSSGTAFATLPNAADRHDIFIAKYNAAGIGIWATRISSTGSDGVVNLLLDSTNNVYISGYYYRFSANVTLFNSSGTSFATLPNAGNRDTFIAKYDAAGIGIWATRISSNGSDLPVNLLLDSANNVYISGTYGGNVILYNKTDTTTSSFRTLTNAGSNDIFIAKYDAAGIGIWATRISSTSIDVPVNMILDSTNNVYISGYYTTNVTLYNSSGTTFKSLPNAGNRDTFIAKYDAAGIGIWATRISSTNIHVPVNMILDSTNNVYISGYYTQANVSMYNSSGTSFATLTNAGNQDTFIAKYDGAGIGIWATRISSTGNDLPVSMILKK